jgi:hypothetical protein
LQYCFFEKDSKQHECKELFRDSILPLQICENDPHNIGTTQKGFAKSDWGLEWCGAEVAIAWYAGWQHVRKLHHLITPCACLQAKKSAKGKDKKEARKAANETIIAEQKAVRDVLAKASEVSSMS